MRTVLSWCDLLFLVELRIVHSKMRCCSQMVEASTCAGKTCEDKTGSQGARANRETTRKRENKANDATARENRTRRTGVAAGSRVEQEKQLSWQPLTKLRCSGQGKVGRTAVTYLKRTGGDKRYGRRILKKHNSDLICNLKKLDTYNDTYGLCS